MCTSFRTALSFYFLIKDEVLRVAVANMNGKNWKKIAQYLPGKTEVQCLHRWTKVLNPNLTKGPWTEEVEIISHSFI